MEHFLKILTIQSYNILGIEPSKNVAEISLKKWNSNIKYFFFNKENILNLKTIFRSN